MSTYGSYPPVGGVPVYSTLSAFPNASVIGALAVATDTGDLYEWSGSAWQLIGGPGAVFSIGPFGSTPNAAGASVSTGILTLQPASASFPGGVSTTTQEFTGDKTFHGTITAAEENASAYFYATTYDTSGTSSFNPHFHGRHARGTLVLPLATQTGDITGKFTGGGYGTTGWGLSTAEMFTVATEAYTDTAQGAKLQFYTTANGTVSPALCLTIDQDKTSTFLGKVLIGSAAELGGDVHSLEVIKLLSADTSPGTAATQSWLQQSTIGPISFICTALSGITERIITANTTDTAPLVGITGFVNLTTNGNSYTNASMLTGIKAHHWVPSGGGTLNINQTMFWAEDDTNAIVGQKTALLLGAMTNATSNVAIADNLSASGDWFINSTSTKPSLFSGQIGVGSKNTSAQVEVSVSTMIGTAQRAFDASFTATSAATAEIGGYRASVISGAAVTLASHFKSAAPLATGGAITRFAEVLALGAQGHTATNNATLADNTSFTGNYFINQSGTDPSILGGVLTLSTFSVAGLVLNSSGGLLSSLANGSNGNVLTISGGVPTWAFPATSGTVTSISVVSTNGLAGTVATATSTPAITLSTTVNSPVLSGNGTAISAATTTGSGSTVVLATGPTLSAPVLGAATGTSLTAPTLIGGTTASSTLTIESTSGAGTTDALIFKTGSQVEAARFTTSGSALFSGIIGLGATDSASSINVASSPATGTAQRAFNAPFVASSAATAEVTGYRAAAVSGAAVTLLDHFKSAAPSAAGGAITRFIEFVALGAQGHTATNNASLSDNVSFTGNWFLNQSGSDGSLFTGQLGVGATDATSALNVASSQTAGTSQRAIAALFTGSASATSTLTAFRASVTSGAAVTTVDHYRSAAPAATGGAITRFTEFLGLGAQGHTATNNASLADNIAYTGNWFINQAGADPSTFQAAICTAGYDTSTATSGTITASANKPGLLITGAGGTTLTIKLPSSPIDGQNYWVASQGAFTTVTWQDSGGTAGNVIGGQATIGGATRGQTFIYSASATKWFSIS